MGAIFYMHQTDGTCAGMWACSRTHQMEKTESMIISNNLGSKPSDTRVQLRVNHLAGCRGSFRLVLKRNTSKELFESSRLEFL